MRTTVLLCFVLLGCANQEAMLDDVEQADLAGGKADGAARPLGAFVAESGARVGEIAALTLAADHSFSRTIQYIDCLPKAACGPETGTYKLTRSTTTSARYIRFYDADGTFMDRYSYRYDGTTLSLRRDGDDRWVTFGPDDCRSNGCDTGATCQICWGHFACVPEGALC
jgi:hypothetical protein